MDIQVSTFKDTTETTEIPAYDDYYDYYYNYTYTTNSTDSLDLPLAEVIPVSILYGFIGITGLIGNLLVIFAIVKVQRMRSITNLFLLSLASADLLLVIVCVPVKVTFLFDLILYVPSTIFQLNRDGSSWIEPVLS